MPAQSERPPGGEPDDAGSDDQDLHVFAFSSAPGRAGESSIPHLSRNNDAPVDSSLTLNLNPK
ncbi:hypothetical protein ME121_0716 [Methylobacterium sp. ME121]|nr:hypothetical protein ME121_0716 [Methylobacterium sp. ME121]GEM98806.1 hypothetical protein MRA01_33460 [Methylobacterium radiotolerans]